jgi:hypothetical protein
MFGPWATRSRARPTRLDVNDADRALRWDRLGDRAEPERRRRQQPSHRRRRALGNRCLWAIGYDDDITGRIPVRKSAWMHWNGSGPSTVPSPTVGSSESILLGVVAAAGSTDVWAWGGSADGTPVERFKD